MKTVFVQLPESVIRTGGETEESLSRESQFLLALKLFELGRLSSRDAAAMCGLNVVDFLLFAEKAVLPAESVPRSAVVGVGPDKVPAPVPGAGVVRHAAVGSEGRSLL